MARLVWVLIGACVLGAGEAAAQDEGAASQALAFVTQAEGRVHIGRAVGKAEAAAMGSELFAGDTLSVDQGGTAVLIYMSGRSVEVGLGKAHIISSNPAKASALIERVMGTLKEIAGPQEDDARPAVHGMARDVEVLGAALPANTRLSGSNFHFSWETAAEVSGYEFELFSDRGIPLHRQAVEAGRLVAADLGLVAGRQYKWRVREVGVFLERSTGECLVELASAEEVAELERELETISGSLPVATRSLFAAAAFYRGQFFYEAERALLDLQKERPLSPLEHKMLMLTYSKMKRWDLLAALEEEVQARVGD